MANVYATKSGLWSDTTVWNTGVLPTTIDDVYTNAFTVTADTNTKVSTIRNSSAAGITAGGYFVLANGVSLSANLPSSANLPCTLTVGPSITGSLIGNITASGTITSSVSCMNASYLTLSGNSESSSGGPCFSIDSGAKLVIYGNVTNQANAGGSFSNNNIKNNGTCTIYGTVSGSAPKPNGLILNNSVLNIFGNITSKSKVFQSAVIVGGGTTNVVGDCFYDSSVTNTNNNQLGIFTGNTGTTVVCNITGNIGSTAINNYNGAINANIVGSVIPEAAYAAINYDGFGSVTVTVRNGKVKSSSLGGSAIGSAIAGSGNSVTIINSTIEANNSSSAVRTNAVGTVTISACNIVNAPNGTQAIYAPKVFVSPGSSATYTRHAVNGYDSYVDYWTSNATLTYPASSDVASNTTYKNNTLSGSMAIPSASSVALGAPVGISTGTAAPLTIDSILNQPIANLTASNSIGARLKNITTSQALSSIANSLNFTN